MFLNPSNGSELNVNPLVLLVFSYQRYTTLKYPQNNYYDKSIFIGIG